jgi:enamine deaminase RidA (YjgF/YER057c/UK114 family)
MLVAMFLEEPTMKAINPPGIAAPVGTYSHAIETPPGARLLHVSGQVGIDRDGVAAADFEGQARLVWQNIVAGMDLNDLVRVNTYLVDAADIPASRAVRQSFLGAHRPASTLLVVSGLASPSYRIEIEAWAART